MDFFFLYMTAKDVKYEDVVSIIKRLKTVAELITELSILKKSALTDGQKEKHIGSKGSTFEKSSWPYVNAVNVSHNKRYK